MKKMFRNNFKRIKFWFFFLIFSGCAIRQQQPAPPLEDLQSSYFIEIPIKKRSVIQCPCIDVEIEGRQHAMELDLGFRGELAITSDALQALKAKDYLFDWTVHGMRNKKYTHRMFRIPQAKIDKMSFLNPLLLEETSELIQDSVFVAKGEEIPPREIGRIGWELLRKTNLLIDSKNQKIALYSDIQTLVNHGYCLDHFIRAPLLLDQGLVQLVAQIENDLLYCMLDTGSTWNILNQKINVDGSLDEVMLNPEHVTQTLACKIADKDCRPLKFHPMPISLPIRVDAILGMEFFDEHVILLDFQTQSIYVEKDRGN